MLNFSEYPRDVEESTLSQVLEATSIPQRYFLSRRACQGILKRSNEKGKKIPNVLRDALLRCVGI